MAIITSEVSDVGSRNGALVYFTKELMKAAGWTVVSSRVGAGTSTASDLHVNVTSFSNINSYIVLQSPHVIAGDRVHLMFQSVNGTTQMNFVYAPNAGLTSLPVSPAVPTALNTVAVASGASVSAPTQFRFHGLADNAFPYGWAIGCTEIGDGQGARSAIAFVPLNQQPASPGKPYWVYSSISGSGGFTGAELGSQDVAALGGCAQPYPANSAAVSTAAPRYADNTFGTAIPNTTLQDVNGVDLGFPVVCCRRGGKYAGVSTFMRWNGIRRPNLTTFNGRTRIVFQDVNFPWDGSTQPIVT